MNSKQKKKTTKTPTGLPKRRTYLVKHDEDGWIAPMPSPPESKPFWAFPGDDRTNTEAAIELAAQLPRHALFTRGGKVVSEDWKGETVSPLEPRQFTSVVERYVRPGIPNTAQEIVRSVPAGIARQILASEEFRRHLTELRGFNRTRMPVLNDSSLRLLPAGVDDATGVFTTRNPVRYDLDWPLTKARKYLGQLLSEFPFADMEADKARVITLLMTAYCYSLLSPTCLIPAFMFNANDAGCGKGLLSKIATLPVFEDLPTMPLSRNGDEFVKLLTAVARDGWPVLHLDNVSAHIRSDALESYLTTGSYSGRILGRSRIESTAKKTIIILSGNHLTYSPDMRRRSVEIELFMEDLQAEHRAVKNPLDEAAIMERQPAILACCYAMVKHWVCKKRTKPTRVLRGFEEWSNVVPAIVEAAGFACPIPLPGTPEGDEDMTDMTVLVDSMIKVHSSRPQQFGDLVRICQQNHLFTEVVRPEGNLDRAGKTALSRKLKRFDRRVFPDRTRFKIEGQGHARRYAVEKLKA